MGALQRAVGQQGNKMDYQEAYHNGLDVLGGHGPKLQLRTSEHKAVRVDSHRELAPAGRQAALSCI